MKTPKKIYRCTECDAQSPKWLGRCPECGAWNTLEEETYAPPAPAVSASSVSRLRPAAEARAVPIDELEEGDCRRTLTGIAELDRVLGGGLVDGSVVLLAGEPGIGKSTLLMQLCGSLCAESRILYVSGEESRAQLKLRAARLNVSGENALLLTETDLDTILAEYRRIRPQLLIVDSIQTIYSQTVNSAPGSVTQVRECASAWMRCAKEDGVSVIIVGHVNKEGGIAGPKVLEHMVDAVLYFEGDRNQPHRIIRAVKNRYGSTNEIGVFEMGSDGLREVENPSAMLLAERPTDVSGSCAVCIMEGTRPIIAEVQALVSPTTAPAPRRTTNGIDYNRMCLLLAVLEKRLGLRFSSCDVYLNVIGGLRIDDPGADAAVALALISSLRDIVIPPDLIAMGEIGLAGEMRTINGAAQRVGEAARLGFTRIALPRRCIDSRLHQPEDVRLVPLGGIYDALSMLAAD
ncbi:MAG: DNA repair protein RadA [Eubacteriales bacterium]